MLLLMDKKPLGIWDKLSQKLLGAPQEQAEAKQQEQSINVEQAPNPEDKKLQFQEAFRKKSNYY